MRSLNAPTFAAALLLLGMWSRPGLTGEVRPCVTVAADPGSPPAPGDLDTIGTFLSATVRCSGDRQVRVTVSSREGHWRLRASFAGPDDVGSTFTLDGLDSGADVRGPLDAWARDLTDDMRSQEDAWLRRRRNSPDWIRASFLAGTTGAIGGRLALITLKWDHAYLTVVQGGGVLATWRADGLLTRAYGFVGPEAGGAFRWGSHWLGVGVQVGFGAQSGGAMQYRNTASDHEYFILGGMVTPTIRYRHYWGLFGLEVSLECPITFGTGGGGVGTPWPIVGAGMGF